MKGIYSGICFMTVLWIFPLKGLMAQISVNDYLDSLSKMNQSDTIIVNVPSKNEIRKVESKPKLTKADSINEMFKKNLLRLQSNNDEAVTFLYPTKLDAGSRIQRVTNDMQQGFPFTISLHHSENNGFYRLEASGLMYMMAMLVNYPGTPGSGGYNMASHFLTGGIGHMFPTRKDHREKIGPGIFWGSIMHNDGFGPITMTLGTSVCYEIKTVNFRPVRLQYDFGKGVVNDELNKTKLKGIYWEFNAHFPVAFKNKKSDYGLSLNPYILYCRAPYYEENVYLYTPSSFIIGCRVGLTIYGGI